MLRGGLPAIALGGLIGVAGIVYACSASAQNWPSGVSDLPTAITLSTTSGPCLAANPARKTLAFDNIAGTINVGYCETLASAPLSPCTAVIGTPPTTTLLAGALHYFVPAPINQFCFIAASGTPSITIREGR